MIGVDTNVLFVTSSYPRYAGDTTAPFMAELAEAVAAEGGRVSVLAPNRPGFVKGARSGVRVEAFSFPFRQLDIWGHGQSIQARGGVRGASMAVAPLAISSMLAGTRKLVADFKPDVVHVHWLVPQGLASVAIPADMPKVGTLHGADVAIAKRSKSARLLFKRLLRPLAAVTSSSDAALEFAANLCPAPGFHRILPGVDTDLFAVGDHEVKEESRTLLDLDIDMPVVLSVGRFVAPKGFEFVLRAAARLRSDCQVVLVGDGPLRDELVELDLQLGLNTRFLGTLPRYEVARAMLAADVLVVPSIDDAIQGADTGPVVVLEALACGLPVVATDVGLARHVLVEGSNGFLVPQADPAALAESISRVIDDASGFADRAGRSFAGIGGWQRAARELNSLYRTVRQ